MSRSWRIHNQSGLHFISFATVGWIDVFTRRVYKEIIVDSLRYCQARKGLKLYAWCVMSNHVHLLARADDGYELSNILRDFKKHTSKTILKSIENNIQESRRAWMVSIFQKAGQYNSNNTKYQFWRQDNKPILVYSPEVIAKKLKYIHDNPVNEGLVEKAEDYLFSSARYYVYGGGLLEVEVL